MNHTVSSGNSTHCSSGARPIPVPGSTAYGSLVDAGELKPGQTVLINGGAGGGEVGVVDRLEPVAVVAHRGRSGCAGSVGQIQIDAVVVYGHQGSALGGLVAGQVRKCHVTNLGDNGWP